MGLFSLPLVFWPPATIPYEIPKVWFFGRWVEILGILGLLRIFGGLGKKEEKKPELSFLVMIFLLVAFFSSLMGANFTKSLFGNYYRNDGLLTLFHLVALFLLSAQFWQDSWARPLAVVLSSSNFLVSLCTIFLGINFRFSAPVGTTFGQPNFLAGYLLVCLPFTTYLIEENKKKNFFWLTVLIFQFMAIFLTLSRIGIAGIFLFGLGWFLFKKGKVSGFLGILGVLGILGLGFLFFGPKNGFVPGGRERIFVKGIMAFNQRPITGWGWANFDYAFNSVEWPIKFNQDVYVDKAHSHLLEILVTTGAAGLLIYLIIILKTLKSLYLKESRSTWNLAVLLSFLLFLFHSQTNAISINEEIIFWMILGIAAKG